MRFGFTDSLQESLIFYQLECDALRAHADQMREQEEGLDGNCEDVTTCVSSLGVAPVSALEGR